MDTPIVCYQNFQVETHSPLNSVLNLTSISTSSNSLVTSSKLQKKANRDSYVRHTHIQIISQNLSYPPSIPHTLAVSIYRRVLEELKPGSSRRKERTCGSHLREGGRPREIKGVRRRMSPLTPRPVPSKLRTPGPKEPRRGWPF